MNNISIYILMILLYLGISKSFSPLEKRATYIKNEHTFVKYFEETPISLTLVESFETGFLIKTYFQRYMIVHPFKQNQRITVRTSKEFYKKTKNFVGLSLFRRKSPTDKPSTIPLPPGTLFMGDPTYGEWSYIPSGEKVWTFHRAYRDFPIKFGLYDYPLTYSFYQKTQASEMTEIPYFGPNLEFGSKGRVTSHYLKKIGIAKAERKLEENFIKYFTLPWSSTKEAI